MIRLNGFKASQRSSEPVGILGPLAVNVLEEFRLPAFDVRLNNSCVVDVVALVKDFFAVLEDVGLELETARIASVNDNLADLEHLLVNLRVRVEEILSGLEVADGLVDVELMQELVNCLEANSSELAAVEPDVHRILTIRTRHEVDLNERLVRLSNDLKNDP